MVLHQRITSRGGRDASERPWSQKILNPWKRWLKTSVHDADRKTRLYALLRHAAFETWLAGLELLIRYDADVNPPAGGGRRDGALDGARLGPTPPLRGASSKAKYQVAVVDLLLAAGADASSTPAMEGSAVLPPLHFAVSLGRRESEAVKDRRYQVVVHLLRHGAQAAAEDANHVTAEARAPAVSPIPVRKITPGRPPRGRVLGTILRAALRAGRSAGALRRRTAPGALGRRSGQRTVPPKPLRPRSAKRIVPKGLVHWAPVWMSATPSKLHEIIKPGRCFLLLSLPLRERSSSARALESRLVERVPKAHMTSFAEATPRGGRSARHAAKIGRAARRSPRAYLQYRRRRRRASRRRRRRPQFRAWPPTRRKINQRRSTARSTSSDLGGNQKFTARSSSTRRRLLDGMDGPAG